MNSRLLKIRAADRAAPKKVLDIIVIYSTIVYRTMSWGAVADIQNEMVHAICTGDGL
jgi:hypothetical protein